MPTMHDYRDWMLQALDGLGIRKLDIFAHHTGKRWRDFVKA